MKNRTYNKLSGIGSRNSENRVVVETAEHNLVGVEVAKAGQGNKPISLSLLVPTTRSEQGSRRVAELSLTGMQARMLYNALTEFYASTNQ